MSRSQAGLDVKQDILTNTSRSGEAVRASKAGDLDQPRRAKQASGNREEAISPLKSSQKGTVSDTATNG